MKIKQLIINADDLNLTEGVSEAILDAHDHGSVTSATLMITQPVPKWLMAAVHQRKKLGVGLHLNISLGESVSLPSKVSSLLTPFGGFRKTPDQKSRLPKKGELILEWTSQVEKFRKVFGKMPTHLDTHHQLHDHPFFFDALCRLSKRFKFPIRRSRQMTIKNQSCYFKTTDFLWTDLDPKDPWKKTKLIACLKTLRPGLNEIMCHPGKNDAALSSISSFREAREIEWKLFKSHEIRALIQKLGFVLTHYGMCYTEK
jgi:chitin disaccharide deacetylase